MTYRERESAGELSMPLLRWKNFREPLFSSRAVLNLSCPNCHTDPLRTDRLFDAVDAVRSQRIDHGVVDGGKAGDGSSLAAAFDAERVGCAARCNRVGAVAGQVVGARHAIVHERCAQ